MRGLSQDGPSYGEGLGSQAAEPRSPAPKTWVIRAEYRGGNWPNTRNPAGGADGVWVGSVGGMLPKLASGQRGSGGVLSTSRLRDGRIGSGRRPACKPGGTGGAIKVQPIRSIRSQAIPAQIPKVVASMRVAGKMSVMASFLPARR